jgi:dTDP-4-dehydrorhamnose 3,5-epimerase
MEKHFEINGTEFDGLFTLQRLPVGDDRGSLSRLFCAEELGALVSFRSLVQINLTHTKEKGTVRGLHYQAPPNAEFKLIQCIKGEVFDVAVDLRRSSPTFLKWHAETLSPESRKTFLIPEGFAHGFQTLCDDCEMLYFHTAPYDPNSEGGVNPQDPCFAIPWPMEISRLSERDRSFPFILQGFKGIPE